ncbi:origin recognition complex subunit 2-like isoform X2 [Oscarella lobularis]|uniref:origin recognition complex subunit 2-like isoform X2 n=1 Tax=Oscarella lobularis TaxID=121494 RepID=UPI003313B20D
MRRKRRKTSSDDEEDDTHELSEVSTSSDESSDGYQSIAAKSLFAFVKERKRKDKLGRARKDADAPVTSSVKEITDKEIPVEQENNVAIDETGEEKQEQEELDSQEEEEEKELDNNKEEEEEIKEKSDDKQEEILEATNDKENEDSNEEDEPPDKTESVPSSNYFTACAKSTFDTTSDRTLARKRLTAEMVEESLASLPDPFKAEKKALLATYESHFDEWILQMEEGFNILLYGLGSKMSLVEKFCEEHLSGQCAYLTVMGHESGIGLKEVLRQIFSKILKRSIPSANLFDQCRRLKSLLEEEETEIYLVIHGIDGAKLQRDKSQQLISELSAISRIHIIATVNHANAALLWNDAQRDHFNWICYDVATFESYALESLYEETLMIDERALLAKKSVRQVMKSLTPNGRGVFILLCNSQLDKKQNHRGLSFPVLYRKCREKFLVSNMAAMKAQLTEFHDHKLISSKKNAEGVEILTVSLPSELLEEIIDEYDPV